MPIYLYECRACGKVFETEQRITADPLRDCDCGGEGTLKRLIQPTAILFKGDGFFVNDTAPKPAAMVESTPAEPTAAPESKPVPESAPSTD